MTASSSSPVVELLSATVAFGSKTPWRDVSLEITEGEFVVVLGPNGAGKTTLLRVLLGLQSLTSGDVSVFGETPKRSRSQIGYAPQRRNIEANATIRGRDLVGLGVDGTHWGIAINPRLRRQRAERVEAAIAAVGASTYAEQPLGKLSGGEQQRLLLAQAIVGEPKILLLDEPLASLDIRSQALVSQLIAALARERGMTVVLVAHDVNPLVGALDRVAYVAGQQIAIGHPDEIMTSEKLSSLYDYPVEVLHDSRGRIVVVGLEDADAHHHE